MRQTVIMMKLFHFQIAAAEAWSRRQCLSTARRHNNAGSDLEMELGEDAVLDAA